MDALLAAGADTRVDRPTCLLTFGGRASDCLPTELRRSVRAAARRGAARIVLAFNGLSLLSADLLDALRRASADLSADGRALVVVCPDPRLRRLLLLTGFTRDFELAHSLDEAVPA